MAALRDHEREQARAQREAFTAWANAQAIWKGERDRILAEAKKGRGEKKTAARADLDALGPEPAAPPSADRTVTEPTFEGLTRLFATGQPSLGIFSDEGGQFLGGHAMNSDNRQKTLTALNDLWQGNPIRRTRAGDGHSTLFGRRLAVHLMAQPSVARAFMADPMAADTGFLPRFLVCEPPSTIGTRFHANAKGDGAALAAFGHRLRAILDTPMPMDEETRELSPRILPLAPEARALLIRFADAIEAAQARGGDLAHVTGYASKAAEQAARIAGVLALWRDLDAPAVTARDMGDGIALAQFYLSEAVRLADAATVSQEIDRAEALRRWLLDSWPHPEIMAREVVRLGPNPLRESPKARAALGILERHGWLVPLDPGTVVRGAAAQGSMGNREGGRRCGLTWPQRWRKSRARRSLPPRPAPLRLLRHLRQMPRTRIQCRDCRKCRNLPRPEIRPVSRLSQVSQGPLCRNRTPRRPTPSGLAVLSRGIRLPGRAAR